MDKKDNFNVGGAFTLMFSPFCGKLIHFSLAPKSHPSEPELAGTCIFMDDEEDPKVLYDYNYIREPGEYFIY